MSGAPPALFVTSRLELHALGPPRSAADTSRLEAISAREEVQTNVGKTPTTWLLAVPSMSPLSPSTTDVRKTVATILRSVVPLCDGCCAAALATDVVDAAIGAVAINVAASGLKGGGQSSRTAPRGTPHTNRGCQDDLASVEALTVASRRTRDRSETTSVTRRRLLAEAHRDLREPLTAMLRLNSDWNARGTDMVAVRMIEQQRQALAVMADLIDSFLTIGKPERVRQAALLTVLASQSVGGELRRVSATSARCAEESSAAWAMIFARDRPEVPVVAETASRKHRVLLIDEDPALLGILRICLLCAGYRVFAVANADEALDRTPMGTSLIDIIIADLDPTGNDDGLAVIDKARLLLGYNVPAVLLSTQASIEIGRPELVGDVSLLRKPVNVDELNALIGEVLKRQRALALLN